LTDGQVNGQVKWRLTRVDQKTFSSKNGFRKKQAKTVKKQGKTGKTGEKQLCVSFFSSVFQFFFQFFSFFFSFSVFFSRF
jgi:hypothetical protein